MGFIHLNTIFIFVAQSCTDKKMSAISAKCEDTTQTCRGVDSSKFVPCQDYESSNSTLQSCWDNHSFAQKKKQCVTEEIFDENAANIDTPSDWYERFTQKKQNSACTPSSAAALCRLLVIRRENGHVSALKTDHDITWNHTPLIPLSDQGIDQTLAAHPEEGIPMNDDTERTEAANNISPCEISFDSLNQYYDLDSFLDVAKDKWLLYYYNRYIRQINVLKTEKKEPYNLYGLWIRQNLKFDGIILDANNNHIPAFIPEAEYFISSQAITITGSDTTFIAPQGQQIFGGRELTSQNNQLSVFKLPVQKTIANHFKPGTKFSTQSHPIQRNP